MKRALLVYVVPMLLGVALVVALSATGAFANPTSSAGPAQYAVAITSVTVLTGSFYK